MKKIQFKSLKTQLLVSFISLIVTICIGFSLISFYVSKKALIQSVSTTLPETAEQAAKAIENGISAEIKVLELVAENATLKDPNIPIKDKLDVLSAENKRAGHLGMSFVDTKGNLYDIGGATFNVADQDSFKKAMAGTANAADPLISKTDGSVIVIYSAPVKFNGSIVGVIMAGKDGNALSEFTNSIKFGGTGQAFMLSKNGNTIAHNNKDLVLSQDNDFENVKKDSALQSVVDIEKKMVAGESGAGEYTYKGKSKYIGYAPVKSTGWSVGIAIETTEILKELNSLEVSIAGVAVVFIILGTIIVSILSRGITKYINLSMNHVKAIAEGDLTNEIPSELLNRKDEIGKMAKSIEDMKGSIVMMIGDINSSSSSIDEQISSISAVAEEISSSSQNVSMAIGDVAKGTTQQASDLFDMTAIVQDFSSKLENMIKMISDIDTSTNGIKTMADSSHKDMANVIESVKNVNIVFNDLINKTQSVGQNVSKINEITTLINSIAEQTNLLALNAAIEAARAGESGRGFAVVADEIRKLAEQSKDSSVSISDLISEISKDTEKMVSTTGDVKIQLKNQEQEINTAIKSFETIKIAVEDITPKMEETNASVRILDSSKDFVLEQIEVVSSVSQEVSASSEEIAAAAHEMSDSTEGIAASLETLSEMSKKMMENVNKFKV